MTKRAEHHPRMIRARAALIMSQPFFGTLALGLRLVRDDSCGTMWTDGKALGYCPAFVDAHSDAELMGVVAHEVLHCAYLHHTRRGKRNPRLWNIAADFAINRDLVKGGFTLPKSALLSPAYDGMSSEEIYSRLLQDSPQPKPGGGTGGKDKPGGKGKPGGKNPGGAGNDPGDGFPDGMDPGACGEVRDAAPDHDAAGRSEAEADWQVKVRQAAAVAKASGAGTMPAEIERIIGALNKPVIAWPDLMRRFADSAAPTDYAWTRPNRRHIAAGRYLPGFTADRVAHIVAVVDTSGSIGGKELTAFASELQAILDESVCDRLTVAYADTKVHGAETFEAGDLLRVNPLGGGGTCFRQPLQWIAENHADATAIIYLTDAETSDWGDAPACPLLWIVYGHESRALQAVSGAPFGEAVLMGS